ncbi:MAG: hypothetical protein ACLS2V_12720 [Clostridium paraputrificum]|uniref:hypothetical protein n=1 Tax=Clostridium sp. TaxID=1506 RepID=UPI0025BEAE94|nr:hypothetical protein [Clostridium sp.]MBS5926133.1 hypothetical protein [Clostridium sp.]
MGMFSWKCAKTGISIAVNMGYGCSKYLSECYLVTPKQVIYEPSYKGYGIFGGFDIYELLGREIVGDKADNYTVEDLRSIAIFNSKKTFKIKVVQAFAYNGEKYEDLKPSKECPYQGYFFDKRFETNLLKFAIKNPQYQVCNEIKDYIEEKRRVENIYSKL